MYRRCWLVFVAVVLLVPAAFARFDPGTAQFDVHVDEKRVAFREFALFHPQNTPVTIKVPDALPGDYSLFLQAGELRHEGTGHWTWLTPGEAGLHRAHLLRADGALVTLNMFVMRPLSDVRDEALNGYRIGSYPMHLNDDNAIYATPKGLIEVTRDLVDVRVSPHFTLGQFLCKQQPDHWPKYLVLQPALVEKLELILEEVNNQGIRARTFHVMSGYRTPWYNRSIGNVAFSRHVWGAAADIFIDNVGDGRMDDLTGSGTVGLADALLLHRIVDERFATPSSMRMAGGLGLYGPRPHRGPFIHVDVRGVSARWEIR